MKSSPKQQNKINKNTNSVIPWVLLGTVAVAFLLFATNALSLSFSVSPSINANASAVYTSDNLNCEWYASADTTSVNVTWYKEGEPIINVSPPGNTSLVLSGNTTKDQEWICEVLLINATATSAQNASVTIANSVQSKPVFYQAGYPLSQNYTLYEDTEYTLYINSTDADGDEITYRIVSNNLCSVDDENTGETTCTPTHAVITGSQTPGSESNLSKTVIIWSDDNNELVSVGNNFTFVLVPVNDQAYFTQNLSDQSVSAEESWVVVVHGSDEELNTPYNFTFWSDINDLFPGLIVLEAINSTSANITFNTSGNQPENLHVGNWSINLNITDSLGTNISRQPSQMTVSLEILSVNHFPEFISDFNESNRTQGAYFESYIFANDSDSSDTLTFSIANPAGQYACLISPFPWSITTVNSSGNNASGRISATLTNNHVACRYVNVTVTDQLGGTNSSLQFLNITNVNDIPEIHEIGISGNISNQSTRLFVSFSYYVNATDIDNYTYDAANTGTLEYSINDTSLFSIGSSSGIFYVNPINSSFIGNWSINVTVSDGEYNVSRVLYLSIDNNSAPYLNMSTNNVEYYQNETIEIYLQGAEYDNDTLNISSSSLSSFSDSEYDFELYSEEFTGDIRINTYLLNMTRSSALAANNMVGSHLVYINLTDSFNASVENYSTNTLNFTILNVNDAPFFDQNQDNTSDTVTLSSSVVNIPVQVTVYATDFDIFLGSAANESLAFSYFGKSSGLSGVLFNKTSNNSAILSFTPTSNGTQYVSIVVTDSDGINTTQNLTVTVLDSTSAPVFHEINPFYNSSTGQTVFDFANSSNFSGNVVNINTSENSSVTFDAIVTNDTSISGNNLTYYWYYEGVLNSTLLDVTPGVDSSFDMNFSFFSSGTRNITLQATDARQSSANWTWVVNVSDVNRPVVYNAGTLENLTVNGTTEFANYLSYRNGMQRFYDPDDDLDSNGIRSEDVNESTSLDYEVEGGALCGLATFTIDGDNLQVNPTSTGLCYISFSAYDPYNETAMSDPVLISVIGAEAAAGATSSSTQSGGSNTRTQVVTVPLEQEVEKPTPIKLLAPEEVTTYVNRTIEIPIRLRNTWTDVVRGISLSGVTLNATFSNDNNATIELSQSYFNNIPVGGEVVTVLRVSNYRSEGPFEIGVFANVQNPDFSDSVSILINSLEQASAGDEITAKVTFAKDMLSENPECRELNDLLDRADAAAKNLNYEEARNLVNAVINGCKFLVNENELVRKETPSIIEATYGFVDENADKILIGAGVLTLLTIISYMMVSIKRLIQDSGKE